MNRDADVDLNELRVDGGAARNDLLLQIQADLLNVPVTRSTMIETTEPTTKTIAKPLTASELAPAPEVSPYQDVRNALSPFSDSASIGN